MSDRLDRALEIAEADARDPALSGSERAVAQGVARSLREAKDGGCTCWKGYERVPGTKPCASKSCRRKKGSKLEEARRGERPSLVKLKRLPDGTFAPKGLGVVLSRNARVELPDGTPGMYHQETTGWGGNTRVKAATFKAGADGPGFANFIDDEGNAANGMKVHAIEPADRDLDEWESDGKKFGRGDSFTEGEGYDFKSGTVTGIDENGRVEYEEKSGHKAHVSSLYSANVTRKGREPWEPKIGGKFSGGWEIVDGPYGRSLIDPDGDTADAVESYDGSGAHRFFKGLSSFDAEGYMARKKAKAKEKAEAKPAPAKRDVEGERHAEILRSRALYHGTPQARRR